MIRAAYTVRHHGRVLYVFATDDAYGDAVAHADTELTALANADPELWGPSKWTGNKLMSRMSPPPNEVWRWTGFEVNETSVVV